MGTAKQNLDLLQLTNSNQSFYRLITGYWMGGGDHEIYIQEVKGGHGQTN